MEDPPMSGHRPSAPHDAAPRDVRADILSEALRPDAGPPVLIHLRPELLARICRCGPGAGRAAEDPLGIPVVVDGDIPAFPGYEIHRSIPAPRSA
jgi:hypothetical protein